MDTTLYSATLEHPEDSTIPGVTVVRMRVGGDRQAAAIAQAILEHYGELADRPPVVDSELQAMATRGEKVTLLYSGRNGLGGDLILAREGTLFIGAGTDKVCLKPKGARTRGYILDVSAVWDVMPGYGHTDDLRANVEKVRTSFPRLSELTQETLNALPHESDTVSVALFGTHQLPDSTATGCIWLLTGYWKDDDICDRAILLVPESHGVSEHGSAYGAELLHGYWGVIDEFEPMDWTDAFKLTDLDFDTAAAAVLDRIKTPAAA